MIVSNYLRFEMSELKPREWERLFKRLQYVDASGNLHQSWKFLPDERIRIPRGAWNLIPEKVEYEDKRVCPKFPMLRYEVDLDVEIDGRKYERQTEAVQSMMDCEQGLIVRQPGSGKSQIILAFASICSTNVLVLVHTEDILQQWIEYAAKALPETEIGVIRGTTKILGQVTIATVQTFRNRLEKDPALKYRFGAVILDECHHTSAKTFETVMNAMHSRYRFGVTASLVRADGKHPYIPLVVGPVIHHMKFKSRVDVKVVPLKSNFNYAIRGSWDWGNMIRALISNYSRNRMIAKVADREVENGNSCLILSRRIEHLERIAQMMETFQDSGALLVGVYKSEVRKLILQDFREGKVKCVLATQLADESLDIPILSRIFLTHPGKAEGRLLQQVGRSLREHSEKKDAIVYDVVDHRVPKLRRQWMRRKRIYNKLGIPIKKRRML